MSGAKGLHRVNGAKTFDEQYGAKRLYRLSRPKGPRTRDSRSPGNLYVGVERRLEVGSPAFILGRDPRGEFSLLDVGGLSTQVVVSGEREADIRWPARTIRRYAYVKVSVNIYVNYGDVLNDNFII